MGLSSARSGSTSVSSSPVCKDLHSSDAARIRAGVLRHGVLLEQTVNPTGILRGVCLDITAAARRAMDVGQLYREYKLFQHLTEDFGHPKLREHLTGVIMLMKYSPDWQIFMDRLDREYPQWGDSLMLPFPENYEAPKVS